MASNRRELSTAFKLYLIFYNSVQFLGWTSILVQFLMHTLLERQSTATLWNRVGKMTYFFQLLTIAEFFHALFRLVPSNPIFTLLQVFGRCMVVVAGIDATPGGKLSPGLPVALFCWSLMESIRYSYYVFHLALPKVPHFLTWLRYTIFIPLYPAGFIGELLCFYWAQPHFRETEKWSISMPNRFNFSFSFYYFAWMLSIGYIPMFPQMYLHMFGQRRKVLAVSEKQKNT